MPSITTRATRVGRVANRSKARTTFELSAACCRSWFDVDVTGRLRGSVTTVHVRPIRARTRRTLKGETKPLSSRSMTRLECFRPKARRTNTEGAHCGHAGSCQRKSADGSWDKRARDRAVTRMIERVCAEGRSFARHGGRLYPRGLSYGRAVSLDDAWARVCGMKPDVAAEGR